jgi:hypothetical protein
MSMKLWRFIWPEDLARVQAEGFWDNDLGGVYFSLPGDRTFGADGKALLDVTFNFTAEELEGHRNSTQPLSYKFPAEFANERKTDTRVVPVEEYRVGGRE